MRNFISEDDIEQALLQKLAEEPFRYAVLRCDSSPDKREELPDGTGRSDKKECVLPLVLRESLARLNPGIPSENGRIRPFGAVSLASRRVSELPRVARRGCELPQRGGDAPLCGVRFGHGVIKRNHGRKVRLWFLLVSVTAPK